MLEALRIVDEVVVYETVGVPALEKIDFDILALGEDHVGARFDEITKWCEEHGKSVVRLKRTKIAFLTLDNLKIGEYRPLKLKEIKKLYSLK